MRESARYRALRDVRDVVNARLVELMRSGSQSEYRQQEVCEVMSRIQALMDEEAARAETGARKPRRVR